MIGRAARKNSRIYCQKGRLNLFINSKMTTAIENNDTNAKTAVYDAKSCTSKNAPPNTRASLSVLLSPNFITKTNANVLNIVNKGKARLKVCMK